MVFKKGGNKKETITEKTSVESKELTMKGEIKENSVKVSVSKDIPTYTVTQLWNFKEFNPSKYEEVCTAIKEGKATAIND